MNDKIKKMNTFLSANAVVTKNLEEPAYSWITLLVLILTLIVAFLTFYTALKISAAQHQRENDLNTRNSYKNFIKLFSEIEDQNFDYKKIKKQIAQCAWIYEQDIRRATKKWKLNVDISDYLWKNVIEIIKTRIEEFNSGDRIPLDIKIYQEYLDSTTKYVEETELDQFLKIGELFAKIIIDDQWCREKTYDIIERSFFIYLERSVNQN